MTISPTAPTTTPAAAAPGALPGLALCVLLSSYGARGGNVAVSAPHPALGKATFAVNKIRSFPDSTHTIQDRCEIGVDRRLMPGEDPETLDTPEQVAEFIVPLCLPSWTETGRMYEYLKR